MKVFITSFFFLLLSYRFFDLTTCESPGPGYFKMAGKTLKVSEIGVKDEYTGHCFKSIKFYIKEETHHFQIDIKAETKINLSCLEFIAFSSGRTTEWKFMFLSGSYHLKFEKKLMSEYEVNFIKKNGLRLFKLCSPSNNWLESLWMTLKMFMGGFGSNPYIPIFGSKIPEYQLNANIDMIKSYTGFEWKKRKNAKTIEFPEENVKNGDFFAITRFDGLDNIIHLGAGSRVGHSVVAIWRDKKLFICESQDANYFPGQDIRCTPFKEWFIDAINADFNVIHLPLNEKKRKEFDAEKAWKFIDKMKGVPYGFHNFLFGYIDTPDKNLPSFTDLYFLNFALSLADSIIPE